MKERSKHKEDRKTKAWRKIESQKRKRKKGKENDEKNKLALL